MLLCFLLLRASPKKTLKTCAKFWKGPSQSFCRKPPVPVQLLEGQASWVLEN